ncbi:MAG: hypothetical protein H8E27_04230 [Verrucomicrobia subdivision 3 bacterium]|nr:hypothetical protein [Limisphaerales bacterium]
MKKTEDILERLLTETRGIPANDRVPYAFEKRIMAHIKEAPVALADAWSVWAQSLWKAVVPCLAVLVMVAVWMKAPTDGSGATTPQGNAAPAIANFEAPGEEDLESIVMLAIDPDSNGE